MLSSLQIENIAVIKEVEIDFSDGFMVLSGQTGAGKSIIIDGINLLLGAKADKELIRNGETRASVSGLFSDLCDGAVFALEDAGFSLDGDRSVLITRYIEKDGRSQVKINGRTANLSVLKSVGAHLVSIHGQSDTNSLVDTSMHIDLIDLIFPTT